MPEPAQIHVTAHDPQTGDAETQVITDNYVVVTAGTAELSDIQVHQKSDGTITHVITVKGIRRGQPSPAPFRGPTPDRIKVERLHVAIDREAQARQDAESVVAAVRDLRRLNEIGNTRRDEISDDDWTWFSNHPLNGANTRPVGWSAALGQITDYLEQFLPTPEGASL